MKILLLKKFVARHILFRFVAVMFFVIGVSAVWTWQPESIPARFLIHLPITESLIPIIKPSAQKSATLQKIIQDRNLSDYNFGGHSSDCGGVLLTEARKCEASLNKARNFIWKHWKAKKRGYVVIECQGIDAASDAHIFIEPDENDKWHIVWRWERLYAASMSRNVSGEIDDATDIRSVKRKRATNDDYEYEQGTLYLMFFDKDGNELQYL